MSSESAELIQALRERWSQGIEAHPASWQRFDGRYRILFRDCPEQSFEIACGGSVVLERKTRLPADCEVEIDGAHFLELISGALNPQICFQRGELLVRGSLEKVLRWNVLFEQLRDL